MQQSPLLAVVHQAMETVVKLSREFGLTPAARAHVTAIEPDDEIDDLDAAMMLGPRAAGGKGNPKDPGILKWKPS
ncbi:MAG: P27 family phage terminase small subunit [Bryobacterales bacterium]|nr:P27 family phage terminase small subunit [Bryobacterales bacterium]